MFKGYFHSASDADTAIKILTVVRRRMVENQIRYVCMGITDAVNENEILNVRPAGRELKKAIEDLIAPNLTYSRYLRVNQLMQDAPNFYDDPEGYQAYLRKRRVEWIDSMIEALEAI